MTDTVIYHRADFDGQFSAAVCRRFMPNATFIGWDFGDQLIDQPEGTTYIVDLSPDCLKSVYVDRSIVWIDHHKSSIDKWDDQLGNPLRGYRIDGVAACRLCWQWFVNERQAWEDQMQGNWPSTRLPDVEEFVNRQVPEPLALTLAGEYDVWDLHDYRSLPFQFGLTAGGYAYDNGMLSMLQEPKELDIQGNWIFPGDKETDSIVGDGVSAMGWQHNFAAQTIKERGYLRYWEGVWFAVIGSVHARNSMWFPKEYLSPDVEALMAWRYDGSGNVSFSLYHAPGREDIDLSKIAVKYGGGGHKGACGFSMPIDDALGVVR